MTNTISNSTSRGIVPRRRTSRNPSRPTRSQDHARAPTCRIAPATPRPPPQTLPTAMPDRWPASARAGHSTTGSCLPSSSGRAVSVGEAACASRCPTGPWSSLQLRAVATLVSSNSSRCSEGVQRAPGWGTGGGRWRDARAPARLIRTRSLT